MNGVPPPLTHMLSRSAHGKILSYPQNRTMARRVAVGEVRATKPHAERICTTNISEIKTMSPEALLSSCWSQNFLRPVTANKISTTYTKESDQDYSPAALTL